jgi:hypothetical protein
MKKMMTAIAAAMVAGGAMAQDTLNWYNNNAFVGPTAGLPLIPTDGASSAIGSMIQLIRVVGALDAAPSTFTHFSGNGIQGDDQVLVTSFVGNGLGPDPFVYESQTLASLGIALGDSVYVRLYSQPTTGAGNAPAAYDYGAGQNGWYFYDAGPSVVSALPNSGGFYDYTFEADDAGDWTFVAVPEPSTMILAGVGVAFLAARRRMRRS